MFNSAKKNQNNWQQIWEKKGQNLKSSKIDNLIDANGHDTKFGRFSKEIGTNILNLFLKELGLKKILIYLSMDVVLVHF